MSGETAGRLVVVAGCCLAAALTACSARDRAGGDAAQQVTTLTFAQPNEGTAPAALAAWADDVQRASHGSLRIRFRDGWRAGQPLYEQRTVADVRNGRVDLGWVGARVFDRLGDDDFQAMLAPFLVDSLALEARVFEAGIADQMLAGTQRLGLVGIGVLPGPLRRVLGRTTAFTTASAFQGHRIAMQDSALTAETLRALGATPVPVPTSARLRGEDGYEQQVESVAGNGYQTTFHFLTSNVNLWPRPFVIVMGSQAYATLTGDQRSALRAASKAAESGALDVVRAVERGAVDELCRSGLRFATADQVDLRGLRRAVAPVYARLREDPRTTEWLDRIGQLKADLGAPPDSLTCPPTPHQGRPGPVGIPTGTYSRTVRAEDYRALGLKPQWDFGRWRLEFDDGGILRIYAPDSSSPEVWTYQTFHGKIRAVGPPGTMVADYRYDHGELLFTNLRFLVCGGVPGNADCLIDPRRPDNQGGYETTFAGTPKPWVRQS